MFPKSVLAAACLAATVSSFVPSSVRQQQRRSSAMSMSGAVDRRSMLQIGGSMVAAGLAPQKCWAEEGFTTLPSGLKIKFLSNHPDNTVPRLGDPVTVDYIGYLNDFSGAVFDDRLKKPFPFTLSPGVVIPAWEEALTQMHVGDTVQVSPS